VQCSLVPRTSCALQCRPCGNACRTFPSASAVRTMRQHQYGAYSDTADACASISCLA
jgi:hypothetical protein